MDIHKILNLDYYSYKTFQIDDEFIIKLIHEDFKNHSKLFISLYNIGKAIIETQCFPDKYNSYYYNYKKYLSTKKNIEISCDFLQIFNNNIFQLLKQIIENGRMLIYDLNEGEKVSEFGISFLIKSFKISYIILNDTFDINTAVTIVHEAAHIYAFQKYKNISNKVINKIDSVSFYTEMYSYFIELIFFDYLESINFNKSDIISLRKAYDLEFCHTLIEMGFTDESNNKIDTLLQYHNIVNYVYSKLVAYEYYDMYKKNPEEAIKNIQLLENIGYYSNMELLDMYGLNKEKIMNPVFIEEHICRNLKLN